MLEKIKHIWQCAMGSVASRLGMVYIPYDIIKMSIEQENYLIWLLNTIEGDDLTLGEIKERICTQRLMTEYLRAGRIFVK